MTRKDSLQILMDETTRLIGRAQFMISICDQTDCLVCADDRKQIAKLIDNGKAINAELHKMSPDEATDKDLDDFYNKCDQMVGEASKNVGFKYNPHRI